ncbi:type II secretion system F family protein [Candidatus Microgenomates bacterium]|nr:MAG: type II secretion system F family protein [Candidatus Microgenomates bacterium]
MAFFIYTARDEMGTQHKGRVEATSERDAVALLREKKLFITSVKEYKQQKSLFSLSRLRKVTFSDIVRFTRQLSTMITAGLQLPEALNLLRTQADNPAFAEVISRIYRDIEGGGSLAASLVKYPQHFSTSYLALIRAGESSGTLDKVLLRLADTLEKNLEFRSKVRSALIYPAIIILSMGIVFVILMVVVVPKLSELYADFGADLPLATRILQGISDFFVYFWWLIIIVGVVGSQVFFRWKKTKAGGKLWDGFVLKLPVFGPLQQQVILVEFTRTLGLLIGVGVHILDALRILTDSTGNMLYHDALAEIKKKVEKGASLGILFNQFPIFPPILSQMVKVGEETGKLDESLIKLSYYFESDSDQKIKGLTTAIEPLIMIVLGVGVGFIVFSIITPIYNLTTQFN